MGRSGVVGALDQPGFSDALGLAAGESGHPARPALDSSSLTCKCAPAGKGASSLRDRFRTRLPTAPRFRHGVDGAQARPAGRRAGRPVNLAPVRFAPELCPPKRDGVGCCEARSTGAAAVSSSVALPSRAQPGVEAWLSVLCCATLMGSDALQHREHVCVAHRWSPVFMRVPGVSGRFP